MKFHSGQGHKFNATFFGYEKLNDHNKLYKIEDKKHMKLK